MVAFWAGVLSTSHSDHGHGSREDERNEADRIPRASSRDTSVVGLIPSSSAAPPRPVYSSRCGSKCRSQVLAFTASPFELWNDFCCRRRIGCAVSLRHRLFRPKVVEAQHRASGHDQRAFNDVLQFTHVAGPRVRPHSRRAITSVSRLGRDAWGAPCGSKGTKSATHGSSWRVTVNHP
jgi:hypothetical protein